MGGTRGGQDQFKWEDVKSDVHRENYLGHSLLAPVGRWQRGEAGAQELIRLSSIVTCHSGVKRVSYSVQVTAKQTSVLGFPQTGVHA